LSTHVSFEETHCWRRKKAADGLVDGLHGRIADLEGRVAAWGRENESRAWRPAAGGVGGPL
jgi:hypothetical protein